MVLLVLTMLIVTGCGPFGASTKAPATSTSPADATPTAGQTGSSPASPPATGMPASSDGPTPGEVLVEGGLSEPRTLNPLFVADPISEQLSHLVFDGLVEVDPATGEPRGALAASWDVSEDGLTYTFHLRDDVLWQDGQPATARDVAFTYARMMDERVRSPRYARLVERVRQVTALDPATVEVDLRRPDASFLTTAATLGIVPEHVLGDVLPQELVTDPFGRSSAVGTGPFVIQQWIHGDRIVFQRNERYMRGAPAVDQYIYRVVGSPEELLAGLREETIDWAQLPSELATAEGIIVDRLPSYDMTYVALQLDPRRSQLFLDPRVRQALLLAVDREAMVEEVWHGAAVVADGTIPPASWAHTPGEPVYRYDPDEARRLLDEAGWVTGADGVRVKDGVGLGFALLVNGENPQRRAIGDWLIRSWREIGIDARPDYQQWSAVRERGVRLREFDAMLLGYRWGVDPDASALWSSDAHFDGFNLGHYANDDVDARLADALAVTDPAERRQLYAEIQAQILADVPVLPLAFPELVIGRSKRLQDVTVTAILVGNRANISEWNPRRGG